MSDSKLDRIETKVDKIASDVNDMRVVQAEQHVILKEHMRRTEANEKIASNLTKLVYTCLFLLACGGAKSMGAVEKIIELFQ